MQIYSNRILEECLINIACTAVLKDKSAQSPELEHEKLNVASWERRRVLIRLFSYYVLLVRLFADRAMDYEIILALCGLSLHPTFMKCILWRVLSMFIGFVGIDLSFSVMDVLFLLGLARYPFSNKNMFALSIR